MSVANVISLLTLLVVAIGGIWTVYISLAKKIDGLEESHNKRLDEVVDSQDQKIKRVYTRQDEVIKDVSEEQKTAVEKIEREFMRVDAHNLSMNHIKEVMEIKQGATIQLFTSQLSELTRRVNELIDRMNHNGKT